jgi:hypothetical protein
VLSEQVLRFAAVVADREPMVCAGKHVGNITHYTRTEPKIQMD